MSNLETYNNSNNVFNKDSSQSIPGGGVIIKYILI